MPIAHHGRPLSAAGETEAAIRHLRAADSAGSSTPTALPPSPPTQQPPSSTPSPAPSSTTISFPASTASYARVLSLVGGPAGFLPDALLAISIADLHSAGVSGLKARCLHDLAAMFRDGVVSDASLTAMDDASLFHLLSTVVKGVGANVHDLFPSPARRSPHGRRRGVQVLYGLKDPPEAAEIEQLYERWRPYRTVGAWYMWRLANK